MPLFGCSSTKTYCFLVDHDTKVGSEAQPGSTMTTFSGSRIPKQAWPGWSVGWFSKKSIKHVDRVYDDVRVWELSKSLTAQKFVDFSCSFVCLLLLAKYDESACL